MIIDIVKFLGSIVLGTGIAFIFAAKANRLAKTKITTIPYTTEYDINDIHSIVIYNRGYYSYVQRIIGCSIQLLLGKVDINKEQPNDQLIMQN